MTTVSARAHRDLGTTSEARRPPRRGPISFVRRRARRWRRRYQGLPLPVRVASAALLLLVVALAVAGTVRLVAARNELQRARACMQRGNAELLHGSSSRADELYAAAQDAVRHARADAGFPASLVAPVPIVGSPVRAVRDAASAGDDVVHGSRILVGAVAAFPIHGKAGVQGDDLSGFHRAAGQAASAIQRARPWFESARRTLDGASHATLGWVASPARQLAAVVDGGIARVDVADHAFGIVQRLTDAHAEFRMLFVSLDTLEARPGGGYVGSFGILHFAHGTVQLEHYQSFESLHAADPPLSPPAALASATGAPWGIENSMWWPSFPASARTAANLYRARAAATSTASSASPMPSSARSSARSGRSRCPATRR